MKALFDHDHFEHTMLVSCWTVAILGLLSCIWMGEVFW